MAKINKKCHIEVPDPYHIKTSPLICSTKQIFYKAKFLYIEIFVMKELRHATSLLRKGLLL